MLKYDILAEKAILFGNDIAVGPESPVATFNSPIGLEIKQIIIL